MDSKEEIEKNEKIIRITKAKPETLPWQFHPDFGYMQEIKGIEKWIADQYDELTAAKTRIGELEGKFIEADRAADESHAAYINASRKEQQVASDAWHAALKWIQYPNDHPNKTQYLASLTGAKKEGGV